MQRNPPEADGGGMRIAYLAHDLNDPAVNRRVRMMRAGGGDPIVLGFHRDDQVPGTIDGAPVVALDRTRDARLAQRAAAVARNAVQAGRMIEAARGSDVIVARNLEMLVLAARLRRALPGAGLAYECLDIHRMLLSHSVPARAIQALERHLLGSVDLLLSSSPAFLREYFARRPSLRAPSMLLENKVLALDKAPPSPSSAPGGPPWTIGWFGMLRCRRTFSILADLTRRYAGRVQVRIAGRASPAEFPDFAAEVAAVPGFHYHGPYTPADLPQLYGDCHFAWAIDYFEEGLNSRWLLPNRLYEAATFGAVPIALRSVETGQWLERRGAGLVVDDGLTELHQTLSVLDGASHAALRDDVSAIPRADLIASAVDCWELVAALGRMSRS